ncbi:hypothetical protein EDD21DRAFT_412021 [Dissophora ornata]|nr:hypothetical protein EDD21DRAFT_412021 [Dissophora ornata]
MSKTNPLDLPEIRLSIAEHLREVDLVRCLRVCWSWHDTFLPLDLYMMDWSGNYPFVFPRMQYLFFRLSHAITPSPANYPALFIVRNQSLVKLHIRNLNSNIDYQLWKVLQELPHLKELGLEESSIQEDDTVRFWTVCENLENLLLKEVTFPEGATPHASRCFWNIRKLQLYGVDGIELEEQFRFISACPNLEDLVWYSIFTVDLEDGLEDDGDMGGPYFEEFAKDIDLQDRFSALIFQALQRHFSHLVELEVEARDEVASKQLQIILCSCPALKKLVGGGVLAKDVVEGKPWVCLSLQSLVICFMFCGTEQHLQPLIFERLAKLTRLEYLFSGTAKAYFQEKYTVPLQFCLESGLDALSGLWRMNCFTTRGDSTFLGESELRWMLVHWKDLISVSAEANIDDDKKIELENLFKSRGIRLETSAQNWWSQ